MLFSLQLLVRQTLAVRSSLACEICAGSWQLIMKILANRPVAIRRLCKIGSATDKVSIVLLDLIRKRYYVKQLSNLSASALHDELRTLRTAAGTLPFQEFDVPEGRPPAAPQARRSSGRSGPNTRPPDRRFTKPKT